MIKLKTPVTNDDLRKLNVGDVVYISGIIYTARDRAHRRILEEGSPVDLKGAVIFHAGPIIKVDKVPEKSGEEAEIVAIGPTTSMRMNPYEPEIIKRGVVAIIGKGGMDEKTSKALADNGAVYLAAVGGCAALYVKSILKVKNVHWIDLGVPEAIWELEVRDFGPLIVAIDSYGDSLYEKVEKRISEKFLSKRIST
ncbi:MAG: fumarate hydratase [Euryarchaeota archaeon]|nr:fumarate hydratase [Euryarchaeota archaeon]